MVTPNQTQTSETDQSLFSKYIGQENKESIPKDDRLAQQEQDALVNDGRRGESYRTHIHRIVVVGIYAIGAVMIALILIRAWHLVTPEKLKWLNDSDCHNVERIIFSGIIVTLATKYFKKYKVME